MTKNKANYPPPSELTRSISLPPGAAQEISAWLGVPLRTLYTWLDGREPAPRSRQAVAAKFVFPPGYNPDDVRIALYTAWWEAVCGPAAPASAPVIRVRKDKDKKMEEML